ncbi:acyl-CoA thioesterase [Fictibacillus gelatini]|uniref:acyl-CoA thioesterase n=1 Tax=Fictibacillus gelatini TaxID=225985 RepID=UPI00041BAD68|nr:thioesterase family protein [Fictibacillus gelatini]
MAQATYIQPNIEEWLKKFKFSTTINVRFCETDMSGHVNNTSYFIYFEQARTEYLQNLGIFDHNLTVVTADMWCHYHSEAFFGEELIAAARVARLGNSSTDIEYAIVSKKENRLVATGSGTIVLVDKETKKSTRVPENIREAIKKFEGL